MLAEANIAQEAHAGILSASNPPGESEFPAPAWCSKIGTMITDDKSTGTRLFWGFAAVAVLGCVLAVAAWLTGNF